MPAISYLSPHGTDTKTQSNIALTHNFTDDTGWLRTGSLTTDFVEFLRNNVLGAFFRTADKLFSLPIFKGSENETAIDVTKLRQADTGNVITFDPGFNSTGSCTSSKTFIDGDKGILRHAGYPIEELVEKTSFAETALLLNRNELPTTEEIKGYEAAIVEEMVNIPQTLLQHIDAAPKDAHPMDILSAVTNMTEGFYPKAKKDYFAMDQQEQANKDRTDRLRLMAVLTTTVARQFRIRQGQTPIQADAQKGLVENFVHMMYGDNRPGNLSEAELTEIFNKLFILHADHEQNCSTSTVRMVASSKADPYAAIAAGINALSGPAHGGANQDVMANLRKIQEEARSSSVDAVLDEQIRQAQLPGDQKVMIPGIGHRVYKNTDPRATALKKACDKYLSRLKPGNNELLDIARKLEDKTKPLNSKGLYPNVDFYSGILYDALGLPEDMFTTMFALGRLPGWLAHMQEQQDLAGGRNKVKIYRPRQVYTGATERHLPAEKQAGVAAA